MKITDTIVMLKTINQRKAPGTFLMNLFFGKSKTHPTTKMTLDVKSGKRTMAPFVSPIVGGKVMARDGYETREISVPKIAPERLTTVNDVSTIQAGENEFSTKTVAQRQKEILVNDLIDLDDAIIRREEWMSREVVLKKSVSIIGDGVDREIKFDEDDTLTLSGTDLWTDSASKPLVLLKEWQRAITKSTGKKPNILVLASDAADAFIDNEQVQAAFDKKHIKLGEIEPMLKDDNISFIGKITALGLEIYSYDEWFLDEEDVEQPYLPSGTAILGSKNLGVMNYGAVKQMEKGVWKNIEARRVPKHITDDDNEIEKLRLSSMPLPTPDDTKAWKVINVI